jgi:hypothetical protein
MVADERQVDTRLVLVRYFNLRIPCTATAYPRGEGHRLQVSRAATLCLYFMRRARTVGNVFLETQQRPFFTHHFNCYSKRTTGNQCVFRTYLLNAVSLKHRPSDRCDMYPYSRKTTSTTRTYFYLVLRLKHQTSLSPLHFFPPFLPAATSVRIATSSTSLAPVALFCWPFISSCFRIILVTRMLEDMADSWAKVRQH